VWGLGSIDFANRVFIDRLRLDDLGLLWSVLLAAACADRRRCPHGGAVQFHGPRDGFGESERHSIDHALDLDGRRTVGARTDRAAFIADVDYNSGGVAHDHRHGLDRCTVGRGEPSAGPAQPS
jgi:hypothetical protein